MAGRLYHLLKQITPRPLKDLRLWIIRLAANVLLQIRLCGPNRPKSILCLIGGIGDSLMATVPARELSSREQGPIWIISDYPSLFDRNESVSRVLPWSHPLAKLVLVARPANAVLLQYEKHNAETDTSIPPDAHITGIVCRQVGLTGAVDVKPVFELSNDERREYAWLDGFIAVQSAGLSSKFQIPNREWDPQRMQEVARLLRKEEHNLVQLGSIQDPALEDVVDLRGKTNLRQLAAVLSHCRLYVGTVGFLMHLARAVDCPAVIVYGGREAPWQSGYNFNANVVSLTQCSPCWRYSKCDFDHVCMTSISASDVMSAIRQKLTEPSSPSLELRAIHNHDQR